MTRRRNSYPPYLTGCYRDLFISKAHRFIDKTNEHVLQGINPGGIYQAIWCRDASYILKDWFLSGNIDGTIQQIYQIWSHQISSQATQKLVYGRGSPEMNFTAKLANIDIQRKFEGALPTTIYQAAFSEIYGKNPDIDSTALIISTTSWVLARYINNQKNIQHKEKLASLFESSLLLSSTSSSSHSNIVFEYQSGYFSSLSQGITTDPLRACEFTIPRMLKAVHYLNSRDIDNDGLLEQSHNEDWMDTALRRGKIVYSQAAWLLALNDLSTLLTELGIYKETAKLKQLADKTMHRVEQDLWSEQDGCYIDLQEPESRNTEPQKLLTQDISLYLIAISQNTTNDGLGLSYIQPQNKKEIQAQKKLLLPVIQENICDRAIKTLDAMRKRTWKKKWPLVTESELRRTGPWVLKPYEYHNHTFWPWTTGIEMLARSRFNRLKECDILLSKLSSENHPHTHAFYEWINPVNDQGQGAYPFRTGISAIRLALADILEKIGNY